MQVTVVGSGTIGSAIAYDLCRQDRITRVQMCDTRLGALHETRERVQSEKFRLRQVNARDPNALASIARGSACVISCVAPEMNPAIAEAAISVGSHFCDLGGNRATVKETLQLADQAQARGVWVVPNCGLAPGLTNILCMHGLNQFDEVDAVRVRVGEIPLTRNPPFNFQISFSAEKLIDDYTTPVTLVDDGEPRTFEPLQGRQTITYPEPYGTLECFYSAGGLSTLPNALAGRVRTLDYRHVAYPGHAERMELLIALGLAEKRAIDVRTHRTYRNVLIRQLRKNVVADQPDVVLLRVVVTGQKDGRRQCYMAEMIDTYNEEDGLTAMKRGTGFSASVVARMLVDHEIVGGGAAPPEHIVPTAAFLDQLRRRDLHITETWHEEDVDINRGRPTE